MAKGEYAECGRRVSGSYPPATASCHSRRPHDRAARPTLMPWSRSFGERSRDLREHLQVSSIDAGEPAPIVSTRLWVAPTVRQLSAKRDETVNSTRCPSSALAPSRLWRDPRPASVAAWLHARGPRSRTPRSGLLIWGNTVSERPIQPVGSSFFERSDADQGSEVLHRQRRRSTAPIGVGGAEVRGRWARVHNVVSGWLAPRASDQ